MHAQTFTPKQKYAISYFHQRCSSIIKSADICHPISNSKLLLNYLKQ
uniref:Uncharacterized protein n=1 Tax=Rhizophora mucronata TaxID=61149 RepID=A0A2P2Q9E4_RHIMU